MRKGFIYLCAIIDIRTRYVVGWGLSNSMTAEWVVGIIIILPKVWTRDLPL
jgi:putative transposase